MILEMFSNEPTAVHAAGFLRVLAPAGVPVGFRDPEVTRQ